MNAGASSSKIMCSLSNSQQEVCEQICKSVNENSIPYPIMAGKKYWPTNQKLDCRTAVDSRFLNSSD